jgi:hypothetical protein
MELASLYSGSLAEARALAEALDAPPVLRSLGAYWEGLIQSDTDHVPEARAAFLRVLTLDPPSPLAFEIHFRLAQGLFDRFLFGEALLELLRASAPGASANRPLERHARYLAVWAHHLSGDCRGAVEELGRARKEGWFTVGGFMEDLERVEATCLEDPLVRLSDADLARLDPIGAGSATLSQAREGFRQEHPFERTDQAVRSAIRLCAEHLLDDTSASARLQVHLEGPLLSPIVHTFPASLGPTLRACITGRLVSLGKPGSIAPLDLQVAPDR